MTPKQHRYLLPDNPSPADYTCLKVYLPNDKGFTRAFFGSLEHLEKWVAWERDGAQTAKAAAASMRTANQMTLDAFILGGCVELIYPPYTETGPNGETPTEQTVDDWLYFVWDILTTISDMLDASVPIPDIIDQLAPVWQARTGAPGVDTITDLVNALAAQTPAERDDALDPDNWKAARDDMVCRIDESCPSLFQISSVEDYYAWLNCAAAKLYASLNLMAGWLTDALSITNAFLTGSQSAQQIGSSGGAGGGFGFGSANCTWTHTVDFTLGQAEGWQLSAYGTDPWTENPTGTGPSGIGWSCTRPNIIGHDSQFLWQCCIEFTMPEPTPNIGSFQMIFNLNNPAEDPSHLGYRILIFDDQGGSVGGQNTVFPLAAGNQSITRASITQTTTKLWAGISCCNSDVGDSEIVAVVISGTGSNPFL